MRAVVQRVSSASVTVGDRSVGRIGHGLLVFLGVESDDEAGSLPIALTGRVWVKCDASQSSIQPGDLLTTSNVPGHAMAATDPARSAGAILGKAMTSLEAGTGMVLVLVSLQ